VYRNILLCYACFPGSIIATITTGTFVLAVKAVTIDDSSVALSWSPPFGWGTTITDYILEYKLHASSTWSVFSDGPHKTKLLYQSC
jgi:hypothetical protein